jgi:hypothetical protein
MPLKAQILTNSPSCGWKPEDCDSTSKIQHLSKTPPGFVTRRLWRITYEITREFSVLRCKLAMPKMSPLQSHSRVALGMREPSSSNCRWFTPKIQTGHSSFRTRENLSNPWEKVGVIQFLFFIELFE